MANPNIIDSKKWITGNRIYNHQERKPREEWKSGKIFSALKSYVGIKPREKDYSICPECGGAGVKVIKERADGRKKYAVCDHKR